MAYRDGKAYAHNMPDRYPRDPQSPHRPALEIKRIDVGREYEVQYWTRAFGVGRDALLEAVGMVGDDARAVSRQLGKG